MNEIEINYPIERQLAIESGDIFIHKTDSDLYIAAKFNDDFWSLISLKNGNRWQNPKPFSDFCKYLSTNGELKRLGQVKITVEPFSNNV